MAQVSRRPWMVVSATCSHVAPQLTKASSASAAFMSFMIVFKHMINVQEQLYDAVDHDFGL